MVIRVFISGISGSKEVKKRQQHSLLILDTVQIPYKVIDITEPGHEEERELMKDVCKKRNSESLPLPPQFFNEDEYCGDWEDFFAASDDDKVHSFLKLEEPLQCEFGEKAKPHETREEEDAVDAGHGGGSNGVKEGEEISTELSDSEVIESPPSMTGLVAPEPQDDQEEELIEMSPSDELTNNEPGKDQPEASDEEGVVEE